MNKIYIKNILKMYSRAIPVEIEYGSRWYRVAHQEIKERVSIPYSVPMNIACGIVAVLSPRCVWEANVSDALKIVIAHRSSLPIDAFSVTTYGANKVKAWRLIGEGDMSCMRGNKVKAFYDNLLFPECSLDVTIDGHAINIARGGVGLVKGSDFSGKEFQEIGRAYQLAGQKVNLRGLEIQAITWLAYKRVYGIRANWRLYQQKLPF